MSEYGERLLDHHQQLLRDSAISPEVASARGYVSADTKVRLEKLGFTREPTPGLLVPIRTFTDDPVTHQYRPDKPRVDGRNGKARKYVSPKDQPIALDVHPMMIEGVLDNSIPLFITEGARKVDAAISAGCKAIVGLSGVWNWRNRDDHGISRPLPEWSKIPLTDRRVVVAFDADVITKPTVRKALNALANFATEHGARSVEVVVLPDLGDGGTGLDDYLASGKTWQDVLELIEPWSTSGKPAGDRRPDFDVSNAAIAADAMRSQLGTGPTSGIFLRGGKLVHCPHVTEQGYVPLARPNDPRDKDSEFQVAEITADHLSGHLDAKLWCFTERVDKAGDVHRTPALFPSTVATRLVAAPSEARNVRRLSGVVRAPFVRPDWTICSTPGFDESTGVLLLPRHGLDLVRVDASPTSTDVDDAIAVIAGILREFPWVTPNDQATFIGAMLMPLLTPAVPGDRPLVVVNAHQPGSGKSLLSLILRELFDGTIRGGFPKSNDEAEKSIHSLLTTSTGSIVLFDNVSGTLRSPALEAALTSDAVDQRKLGASAVTRGINDRTWVITANNLSIAGDLIRRCVWSNIDPGVPNPELRTGFAIPNLPHHVRTHRSSIVAALLTMVAAWVDGGSPTTASRSDSFAPMIDTINAILRFVGIEGQMGQGEQGAAAHDEHAEWHDFLHAVAGAFGGYGPEHHFTARQLLDRLTEDPKFTDTAGADLRDAIPDELAARIGSHRQPLTSKSLAKFLTNRNRRFFGDVRLVTRIDPKRANVSHVELHGADLGGIGVFGGIDYAKGKSESEYFEGSNKPTSEPGDGRFNTHQYPNTPKVCACGNELDPERGICWECGGAA